MTNQIPQVGMTREQAVAQRQRVRSRNHGRQLANTSPETRVRGTRQVATPESREADRRAATARRVAARRAKAAASRPTVATPSASTSASVYGSTNRRREAEIQREAVRRGMANVTKPVARVETRRSNLGFAADKDK